MSNLTPLIRLLAITAISFSRADADTCEGPAIEPPLTGVIAARVDGAIVYRTQKLAIDADGAPNSYRLDGRGLSYTCDGVAARDAAGKKVPLSDPKWENKCIIAWTAAKASGDYRKVSIFGFATDRITTAPLVQKVGDPLPGIAYISTTSMPVPGTPDRVQRHYVDATKIPYLVLPGTAAKANGIEFGSIAAIYRVKTDRLAFAVYADSGNGASEASVRLHQDIGGTPIILKKGVPRARGALDGEAIVIAVFPMVQSPARLDDAAWRTEILAQGTAALDAWGGQTRLAACIKQ